MLLVKPEKRGTDDFGCGDFGASRGSRDHNGIDYCVEAGQEIATPVTGVVTKLGYTYGSDLFWRYVEITCDATGLRHRLFYVEPGVDYGQRVDAGDLVGVSQHIAGKYNTEDRKMKNHVHYEIMTADGKTYLNPEATQ